MEYTVCTAVTVTHHSTVQVMLIKNLDEQLVNGSMGTITEFCYPQDFMLSPNDPMATEEQPSSKPPSKAGPGASSASVGQKWPVVEFLVRQGSHTGKRRMLMQPETWKVELPNGELQVSRTQVRVHWLSCNQLHSS